MEVIVWSLSSLQLIDTRWNFLHIHGNFPVVYCLQCFHWGIFLNTYTHVNAYIYLDVYIYEEQIVVSSSIMFFRWAIHSNALRWYFFFVADCWFTYNCGRIFMNGSFTVIKLHCWILWWDASLAIALLFVARISASSHVEGKSEYTQLWTLVNRWT